ncbi:putative transcription factor-like 5 protein [Scophthalmus maximus]|uniref:Putative transcription factor-like 5 protein n=1 Tax=Scophthalmus maximus TaxID=52904 RepID=A0A2U9C142_SCOMX|nr:putative transcription factor-like 5 protein [Scophthalmus maximus]
MMGPGLDSRGSERTMRYSDESASLHFKGPHHPDPALFNGPPGPAPNIGGKSCLGFDSPQNQQSGKPQRHRVALLPTPTEGLIRFPNRMINSSDAFSPKQKQMRSSADRESSRDRAVGRKRALDQEQRDEQEGSPARKISTAVIANTATGKEKREETDKQGMSARQSFHVPPPPSSRETSPVTLPVNKGRCLTHDQGQMSGAEVSLTEMTPVEYTNLQHLVQVHMGAPGGPPDGPDVRGHPAAGSLVTSPWTSSQPIDLSTWTDEHCPVTSGEKTPGSYGDVPGFVLARIIAEESPKNDPSANSSTPSMRPFRSAAKVCLEKRFNATDGPRRQDIQAAILNNFLTRLHESAEAPEVLLPQVHKWMKGVEVFSPRAEAEFDPVTTTCGVTHQFTSTTEDKQQANTGSDVVTPAASTRQSRGRSSAKANAPGSDSGSSSRKSLRREQHNSLERERRKRIRLFCDELNALVPFCDASTDRVTTLHWTTAFLRFISKMFGDALKKDKIK